MPDLLQGVCVLQESLPHVSGHALQAVVHVAVRQRTLGRPRQVLVRADLRYGVTDVPATDGAAVVKAVGEKRNFKRIYSLLPCKCTLIQ